MKNFTNLSVKDRVTNRDGIELPATLILRDTGLGNNIGSEPETLSKLKKIVSFADLSSVRPERDSRTPDFKANVLIRLGHTTSKAINLRLN